jgi:hypothetical protein
MTALVVETFYLGNGLSVNINIIMEREMMKFKGFEG